MGSHHSSRMVKDEWLTPPFILEALGQFSLDPCAPIHRPWPTAREHYTIEDDGLSRQWSGRVWLNPPYGREAGKWISRLANHGNGTALIFARTETELWFKHIWHRATSILFLKGRLHFHHVDGVRASANAGAPSALVSYGMHDARALRNANLKGRLPGKFISMGDTWEWLEDEA